MPGQDGHAHRRAYRLRPADPARRPGAGGGGARSTRRRGEAERDDGRDRPGLPGAGRMGAHGVRAVLVGAQVECGQLRRSRQLGAGSAGDGAARAAERTLVAGRRTGRGRPPGPRAGMCRRSAERGIASAGRARGSVRPAGRAAQARRCRHPRLLRRPGRDAEGDLRRQPPHRGRGRRAGGPAGLRGSGRCARPPRRPRSPRPRGRRPLGLRPGDPAPETGHGHSAPAARAHGGDDRRRGQRCAGAQARRPGYRHGIRRAGDARLSPSWCCWTAGSPPCPGSWRRAGA